MRTPSNTTQTVCRTFFLKSTGNCVSPQGQVKVASRQQVISNKTNMAASSLGKGRTPWIFEQAVCCVCVHLLWMCRCTCGYRLTCTGVCGGERTTLGIIPYMPSMFVCCWDCFVFRHICHWPRTYQEGRDGWQEAPGTCFCLLSIEIPSMYHEGKNCFRWNLGSRLRFQSKKLMEWAISQPLKQMILIYSVNTHSRHHPKT